MEILTVHRAGQACSRTAVGSAVAVLAGPRQSHAASQQITCQGRQSVHHRKPTYRNNCATLYGIHQIGGWLGARAGGGKWTGTGSWG